MSRKDDVIELGSSDEELQPPSKKHKPMPNAMVHIPHKLPGITIRPAKSSSSKINIPSKKIPVKKTRVPNPLVVGMKTNEIRQTQKKTVQMPAVPTEKNIANNAKLLKKISIPISGVSGYMRTIPIKAKNPSSVKEPIIIPRKKMVYPALNPNSVFFGQPIRPKGNLAPEITVKRLKLQQNIVIANRKIQVLQKPGDILPIEIDDDDTNAQVKDPTSTGPQWYMRPEEEKKSYEQEIENNSEPKQSKMIEITIEDSPVKAVNKKTCEIGTEYAVTIEDSPVQVPNNKGNTSESEDDDEVQENKKDHHSKKKLVYPITSSPKQTVEVEFEPIVAQPASVKKVITKILPSETIEIEESPVKISSVKETSDMNTPKKVEVVKPIVQSVNMKSLNDNKICTAVSVSIEIEDAGTTEFHPIYQSFIDLCFKLENSDDMKKIVEKKIKGYYTQVPKKYTESEEFLDMVSGKIISMKSSPDKMYLFIKDVVDELNLQRKMAKTKVEVKDEKSIEAEKFLYGEESQFDSKKQRQIRKLEKTLKKLHRAIQKLEEQEVDFDDDEDSVYLLTERYKERMVKVHAKFCQLTNTKMPSEPRVHIDARPGQPQGPAKRLEKWINRKVPIGTPLPFPDFHDVLRCVKEANEQDQLGWNDVDVMEEARDLFTRCGKKLQRRRQENEWRLAVSRIPADQDPFEESEDLKRKLQENRQTATKKYAEVFNKFADKQNQLNLEPIEIGDKEADESPADSEDEEEANNEREALEDKEKRKERIKRLLQERNKKMAEDKKENNVGSIQINKEINSVDKETNPVDKERDYFGKENDSIDKKTDSVDKKTDSVDKKTDSVDKKTDSVDKETDSANKKPDSVDIETDSVDKETDSVDMETDSADKETKSVVKENYSSVKENSDKTPKETKDSELIATIQPEEPTEITVEDDEVINSLSESSQIDSDIDELHLLQKLHTSTEINESSLDSSSSESPIDISDSLDSNSDNGSQGKAIDVISIENSSYSDTENTQDNMDVGFGNKRNDADNIQLKQANTIQTKSNVDIVVTEQTVNKDASLQTMEIEYSPLGNARKIITSHHDDSLTAEEILLASSEDDSNKNSPKSDCMNANDDALSIGETCIELQDGTKEKDERTKDVPKSSAVISSIKEKTTTNDNETSQNNSESKHNESTKAMSDDTLASGLKHDGLADTAGTDKILKNKETSVDEKLHDKVINNDHVESSDTL